VKSIKEIDRKQQQQQQKTLLLLLSLFLTVLLITAYIELLFTFVSEKGRIEIREKIRKTMRTLCSVSRSCTR
jgi:hypothetical protein